MSASFNYIELGEIGYAPIRVPHLKLVNLIMDLRLGPD